jgi:membrane fusion protein (multidrug efflux system)
MLLPGAFANVSLVLVETRDALLIPAEALIPDFEAAYVFVAVDGKVERRRVVTGTRTESRVQIVEGLAAGDVVVTSGLQQLRAGARVEIAIAGRHAAESDKHVPTRAPAGRASDRGSAPGDTPPGQPSRSKSSQG